MRSVPAVAVMFLLLACSTTTRQDTSPVITGLPSARTQAEVTTQSGRGTTTQQVAAPARPRPYPVPESDGFRRAVEKGTRTRQGLPGARYWTQYARYTLSAELDPQTRVVSGTGRVAYLNRSPDTLSRVAFHVRPNLFAPNAMRNRVVPIVGGAEFQRIAAAGQNMRMVLASDTTSTGYSVVGTIMWITLPTPIAPGGQASFEFDWRYTVPPDGAPRTGTDGEVFFMAYWYPQLAVYDDLIGWNTDQYMSNAEFYMGYADYDVSLTVPEGWLVGSTGQLQNAADVLSEQSSARIAQAATTRNIVNVVTASDRGAGSATKRGTDGKLTWRFLATNVRDFAWGTSANYLWDATSAFAGDVDGNGTMDRTVINTFYRPEKVSWSWDKSALFAQNSVDFLSSYLWAYPYPHMTAMDGVVSCSGMEYPMMTCIGGQRDTLSLYSVTVHEIAHMWFPMQVGSNEKRHSWQDEGFTRFNQAQAMRRYFGGYDLEALTRERYLTFARTGGEVELMRHGDQYPVGTDAFRIASYDKQSTLLSTLRALLGEQVFTFVYRQYGMAWRGKHPAPNDFFNFVEQVAERDLSWFWSSWYYETWVLDQAIGSVTQNGNSLQIVVEDLGLVPMPVHLAVTYVDGTQDYKEITVDPWLAGARKFVVQMTARSFVESVEIDPKHLFPDIDRTNQIWTRR